MLFALLIFSINARPKHRVLKDILSTSYLDDISSRTAIRSDLNNTYFFISSSSHNLSYSIISKQNIHEATKFPYLKEKQFYLNISNPFSFLYFKALPKTYASISYISLSNDECAHGIIFVEDESQVAKNDQRCYFQPASEKHSAVLFTPTQKYESSLMKRSPHIDSLTLLDDPNGYRNKISKQKVPFYTIVFSSGLFVIAFIVVSVFLVFICAGKAAVGAESSSSTSPELKAARKKVFNAPSGQVTQPYYGNYGITPNYVKGPHQMPAVSPLQPPMSQPQVLMQQQQMMMQSQMSMQPSMLPPQPQGYCPMGVKPYEGAVPMPRGDSRQYFPDVSNQIPQPYPGQPGMPY
ncbi:hypothetical protein TRFO_06739 [Tritrichomonas foetus]|uniref:Uncharacterized protein n=1 Tax=Tritrichomonas foetus TaxID=1144522 RepID=A0A1J4JXR9_9EUKA|nr:hypothetical protein TRFO_06739 [Tritrichomonas foetus]|eukprot:OHT03474.1 hypothetical protein TRFO_06739 [Tritrichomonas foetus]